MFKLIVPLVFVLLADGKLAEGNPPPAKHEPSKPIAPERAGEGHKGAPAKAGGASADGHGDKPALPAASEGERTITPPGGVSASAWREEMNTRAGNQKAITERERLEALSTDLAKARSALREETTRLEGLMDKTRGARTGAATAAANGAAGEGVPANASAAAVAAGAASGMGIGDPMAPNAYYRPTPPPPNFAVQVEVVSKAMKSMKPEQAAAILAHLERGLAAEVLQRMRPADAGAILGFLKPEVGAVLAAEIVSRPPVGGSRAKESDKESP